MAIRVRCKCGRSLKISSKLADKHLNCPACARPFRIPAEKFAAAVEKRATAQGGAPAGTASPADPVPASLDDELGAVGPGLIDFSQSDVLTLEDDPPPAAEVAAPAALTLVDAPNEVAYAADPTARIAGSRRVSNPISGPQRRFWPDVATSFIYPVKGVHNVITLAVAFVVSAVGDAGSQVQFGLLGIFIQFSLFVIIGGWFASMYLSVIQETATGSEDLPGLSLEGGWWDDILVPAFRFIGAFALVLAPAFLLAIAGAAGLVPVAIAELTPIWFFGGLFLLPMSLMLFSFHAASAMFRIDLVLTTIARTILPYLSIWGILLLVSMIIAAARGSASLVGTLIGVKLATISAGGFLGGLLGRIALSWISIYFSLVAMRTIGLYYLHFKRRFAFVME